MNWIKQVRLENFQSHLDTTIELSDGLNVIVGQSDSGKTAIIRAIRWALFNQPRGTDFIHVGANFVRVTVLFSTGVMIIRERTASKNRYIIREQGKEELVLEGFGIHVPKEVLDAHGIKPLRIDQDTQLNLHVAQQLEGPFLLEQTSSVRAKTIGRMSGAHILDMAIRDTARDTTKLSQYIRAHTEDVECLETSLEPYSFLDEAKKELVRVERRLASIETKQEKRLEIIRIATKLRALHEQEREVQETMSRLHELEQWQVKYEQLLQTIQRYKRVRQLRAYYDEIERSIFRCDEWIAKTEAIDKAEKTLDKLRKATTKRTELIHLKRRQDEQLTEAKRARGVLEKTRFATVEQEQSLRTIDEKIEQLRKLQPLSLQIERQQREINRYKQIEQRLSMIEDARNSFSSIEKKEQKLRLLVAIAEQYTGLQKRTEDGAAFIAEKQKEEQQLIHRYEHLLLEEGTCPTCGSQLEKQTIEMFLKQ